MPPQKQTIDPFGFGLATAGFAGLGGVIAPLTALPIGAAAVLCGLPAAVAAAVAGRRPGIFASIALGVIGIGGVLFDGLAPAAIASSVFVIASATATLTIATTRRRRHERTVFGLERLNHQILGDATRRPEYHIETNASVQESHEFALLALHELARRVATHTTLETLLPTVIAATKSLTSSEFAAVYLWDPATRSLQNALPQRSRDVACYVPDPSTGAAAWVIATQQIYTAAAADSNAELAKATAGDARRPAGIAPLIAGNDLLGLLISDVTERHAVVSAALLANVANISALGLRSIRSAAHSVDCARRDPVTGFIDRSRMAASVEQLVEAASPARPLAVLAGAIDHFASIREQHGRDAADHLIQEVATLWKASLPERALICRLDVASFLAVVPESDDPHLREIAESLRESVSTHPFLIGGANRSVTTSLSISEWPSPERSWDAVLAETEDALQRVQNTGGNCVSSADAASLGST